MIRSVYTFMVIFMLAPQLVCAESIRLTSDYLINFTLPSDRWSVSVDAPELAIEAMLVDMVHDKKKKREEVDMVTLRALSEEFIKVNDLFIYNQATEAYLMISLSPYGREENPPTEKAIQASARWAVEALKEHAEVEDFSSYQTIVQGVEISGVEYATQVVSNNPLFGELHNFIGVIGFAYPHWVFMYYNDKAKDPEDLSEMQQIIQSVELINSDCINTCQLDLVPDFMARQ